MSETSVIARSSLCKGGNFEADNKTYNRKMKLKREQSGCEEQDGVFYLSIETKQDHWLSRKSKRTLLCLSDKGDLHSVIDAAVSFENAYLSMPGKNALVGFSSEVLLSKIASLSEARNAFADACNGVDSHGKKGKRFDVYGADINIRMSVLSEDICTALTELPLAESKGALRISPISKPEAPTLRGPIDAIPYSRGESAKNHLVTRKARSSLLGISAI